MSQPHLKLEHEITEVTRQLAGVEAQLATAIETFLDHHSQAGHSHDPTSIKSIEHEPGGTTSFLTSSQRPRQETEPNLLRPSKSNVAIIKIESSRPSSRRRSQCSSKVTLNSLPAWPSSHIVGNQRKPEINQSQSFTGSRRNSRSQSVKVNCSLGPLIKANIKKCDAENEDSLDGDDEKDLAPCHENIVRRSKSVVIHCNSRAPPVHRKTNPVICDTKHDALDDQHDDCLSIKENLDDIKLEIERLIQEREHFFQENSALKFYKRAYQDLQTENSQLREIISKLRDKQTEEDSGSGGGQDIRDRSSPDGQDVSAITDREPTQHSFDLGWTLNNPNLLPMDRANCYQMTVGLLARSDSVVTVSHRKEINEDEAEIRRWTPQLAVTESKPAVRELIIFNTTDVQADTAETAGTQQYLNNRRGDSDELIKGTCDPENLEDLYQDITKNVLKKIVKIRNLKNAIVQV